MHVGEKCMLVKNLHKHSPKFHDVGENNVGGKVCWRKKICSFKIICLLVKSIFAGYSNVGEICMLVKTFTDMQLLGVTQLRFG